MADAEVIEREFCPNLTSNEDIINRVGYLSVDILNKEKVIGQLWKNIDELTAKFSSLTEETKSLNSLQISNKDTLKSQEEMIQKLGKEKQSIESTLRGDIDNVTKIKDERIHELEKSLKTIEAEAVINQEEVRKELMETRNELFSLKESIKSKPKRVKKKTIAKPARA